MKDSSDLARLGRSRDAEEAMDAYRERLALSAEARVRLRERLGASIAAGADLELEASLSEEPPPPPRIDLLRSAGRIGVGLAAAAAVLAALRLGGVGESATRDDGVSGAQAGYEARPQSEGGEASPRPGSSRAGSQPSAVPGRSGRSEASPGTNPSLEVPSELPGDLLEAEALRPDEPEPAAASASGSPPPRSRRVPPPSSGDAGPAQTSLAAEMALLRRARAALRQGDAPGALAVLGRHARRFPRGQMLEDRQALRVQALCDAGRPRQAREAAAAFVAAHPGSPHAGRIKKTCLGS